MSENGAQLETYWGPKPPLTEQTFNEVVDSHVADVVFEPHMEGPGGRKGLGHLEGIAHLADEYGESADLYRVRLSQDQSTSEQERSFLHEVLHIYLGALSRSVARARQAPPGIEEHLQREEEQAEAETQRFYNRYPELVRQVLNRFRAPALQPIS